MSATAVSVVIPYFNRPELVRATVQSLLAQTLAPAEILVVDDGSPTDVAPALAGLGPTVKLHRQANAGVTTARNTGVRHATSPWIAFCDHDDLWRPDKLARQMHLHATTPGLLYSFTNFTIVSDDIWSETTKFDTLPPDFFAPADPVRTPSGDLILGRSLHDAILSRQPIFPSTVVLARSLFDSIGGFEPSLGRNVSEDLEFTLRCLRHPAHGVVLDPVVGVRKHPNNTSRDNTHNILHQIEILHYVLAHHPLSDTSRSLIHAAIANRSIIGSCSAFTEHRFDLHQQLLANVPAAQLTLRLRLKQAVAALPRPLAARIGSLLASS